MKLKQSGLQTTTALHASDYCSVLNPLFVLYANDYSFVHRMNSGTGCHPLLVCTSYHYCFGKAHHIRLLLCVGIKVVSK